MSELFVLYVLAFSACMALAYRWGGMGAFLLTMSLGSSLYAWSVLIRMIAVGG